MLPPDEEWAVGRQRFLWTIQHWLQEHHSQHSCNAQLTAFHKHCQADTSVCLQTLQLSTTSDA